MGKTRFYLKISAITIQEPQIREHTRETEHNRPTRPTHNREKNIRKRDNGFSPRLRTSSKVEKRGRRRCTTSLP